MRVFRSLSMLFLLGIIVVLSGCGTKLSPSYMNQGPLESRLARYNLEKGDPVFIRIFKEQSLLELWMKNKNNEYVHFTNYPICTYSGSLGPKKYQGDKMAPEGFYEVNNKALNPYSQYYKSFNLGYPNAFDRFHKRTGDYLMVHGDCVSVGCYAMTDPQIKEIYQLVEAALKRGEYSVKVHVFPFKMTDARMARATGSPHYEFWTQLKKGYDAFEIKKQIPTISVVNGKYIVQ